MIVLNFLIKNWDSIVLVMVFIVFILMLVKKGETKMLKSILFSLVTQAEKQFGSGTGSLKFATVADWIWQRIPLILRILFTKKDIEYMIEQALETAKSVWKNNENLKEYIETEAEIKVKEHPKEGEKESKLEEEKE